MSVRAAHILEDKWRSDDIRIQEDADFSSLLLPKELLRGLTAAGFKSPSPIQLKAIPVGKIGKDLIVQAKSGTGKTLVFTVVALNMLLKGTTHPQVLIMAPTREIACQICQVIKCVGVPYKGLACEYFIGGRKLEEDVSRIQECQIIVGTPGRIKQLITCKVLKTAGIRLFVLDEADQLLKESSFITDIDDIFRALPRDKQLIATSATYPDKLKRLSDKYFRDPLLIRLNKEDIGLLGMVHYYHVIPVSKLPVVAYKEKLKLMENVLLSVKFAQCLVFCNMVSRVENLCVEIKKWGFATSFISSAREQEDRLKAIELLKRFKCKVLVSSDVSARGIDAENVDLVINFDLPYRLDTYFHRVGRAGRYGSKCASVTFITNDEIEAYQQMQTDGKFQSYPLPDLVPKDLISLQPKIKPVSENEELPLHNESESSSDTCDDLESLNENGVDKQEQANGFTKDIELNDDNELFCSSKVENSSNLSDEKLIEVVSTESRDSHEMRDQLLCLNSNSTNSVKEDDNLSSTSASVELELNKIDSPVTVKLKQPEVVTKVSSSEIVAVEHENDLKVNKNNNEESCENNKLFEEKLDQKNMVTLVEENIENCQPVSGKFTNNAARLQQITVTSSCLVDLENDPKISLKETTIGDKSLVTNSEFDVFKHFNDPKSKELISSFNAFIKKYENCNRVSEEFTDHAKSSQSINVQSNVNKFSPISLEHYSSGLSQYHYNVRKDFIVNFSEYLTKYIGQGCGKEKSVDKVSELKEQTCLKQNYGKKKIQNSSLDSKLMLFSTPKAEVLSSVKSSDSSDLESSSGSDKVKLIEHFNLRLASIQKIKPVNKNSTPESSFDSESNSDTSVNSEDAMHLLTKEFNKVSQERAKCYNKEAVNIINYAESSSSSSSDSGTSIDSENAIVELEQKFAELIKARRSEGPSKDMEETTKILHEIQSTKKYFKGIEIVDTRKHAESSSSTSDSDTSIDNGKTKDKPKNEFTKQMQNIKGKVGNTSKSSESSSYKTKIINSHVENKITHSSETESDMYQYSKESPLGLQDQRKTFQKNKTVSKTDFGCRARTINGPVGNKITYYSGTSSEAMNDDQFPKESGCSLQVGNQRKSHKKGKARPKTEPSRFDYSDANETSNSSCNPASERPILGPSPYQIQPSYASNPHDRQYFQQSQNNANERPFLNAHSNYQIQPTCSASNPYYPQHFQNHANGQFLGTQHSYMQPTYVPNPSSQSYASECPHKEFCQISKMHSGCKLPGTGHTAGCSIDNFHRDLNPSTNYVQSNYQIQSSCAYNQCFAPSQHPCHPPNEFCQSPACAAWYDMFYKQWQFINQTPYF